MSLLSPQKIVNLSYLIKEILKGAKSPSKGEVMRLLGIILFITLFSFDAYSFWIWSPKTKEWKNPKSSVLTTPYVQHKEAVKLFESGSFSEAHQAFKKLLVNYPDAKEAAEAQYYLARSLEELGKPYEAFLEYQKLIDSYPNSQRISEAVEKEYNIGEYFLSREHKQLLGMSVYDFVEHPSIEIFKNIVDKVPYSDYASRAQYKLGVMFMQLGRYGEAREAFGKVIDNYSDTEWSAPAKYQLAMAASKEFSGVDYDSSYVKEATARLDEFIKDHPDAQISSEAENQLKGLKNREAKKTFEIAQFYEKQDQYKSALIYYKKVVDNYSGSDYCDVSFEKIKEMSILVKGNITKKDLKRMQQEEEAEAKRREKARLKEESIKHKQSLKEKRIQEKLRKKEEAEFQKEVIRKKRLERKAKAAEK